MRKKIFLVLFTLLFLVGSLAFAGTIEVNIEEEVEVDLQEEVEVEEEIEENLDVIVKVYEEKVDGFKMNGGPALVYMQLDLQEFNNTLPEGFAGLPEEIFLAGGGGLIGAKNGIRFGGFGYEGENSSIGEKGKKVSLKMSYGGFLYEKGLYSSEKVDLAFGALIGGGQARLDMIYGNYDSLDTPNSNSFTKDFFFIEPRFALHYQLGAFMGLDLSAGYFCNLSGGKWEYFGQKINLDLDNLSSPVASVRLSFGF